MSIIVSWMNISNPASKWYAMKAAEQSVESELWKFRARIGT